VQAGSVRHAGSAQSVNVLPVHASLLTPSAHCPASVVGHEANVPVPQLSTSLAAMADPIGPGHTPPVHDRSAVHDVHGTVPQLSMQQADHEARAHPRTPTIAHSIVTTKSFLILLLLPRTGQPAGAAAGFFDGGTIHRNGGTSQATKAAALRLRRSRSLSGSRRLAPRGSGISTRYRASARSHRRCGSRARHSAASAQRRASRARRRRPAARTRAGGPP
jgi:hypothetical protein